jgi:putative hemolysin
LNFLKRVALSIALTAFVVIGFGALQDASATDSTLSKAAQYCAKTGGVAMTGIPYYGTNGGDPLQLAGSAGFCQYTAKDSSQIYVLLSTLYATRPSLASTAYYAKVKAGQCNGNPASCYCTLLGGSDQFGGTNGAGGGWVFDANFSNVLEACIFPDLSSIDSWGLLYHSAGIIRGKNLSNVLRYKNP